MIYLLTEPLVPYHVTVVAVNLAGPGEQETMNFFTREGGMYNKVLIIACVHFVCNQSST